MKYHIGCDRVGREDFETFRIFGDCCIERWIFQEVIFGHKLISSLDSCQNHRICSRNEICSAKFSKNGPYTTRTLSTEFILCEKNLKQLLNASKNHNQPKPQVNNYHLNGLYLTIFFLCTLFPEKLDKLKHLNSRNRGV